MFRSAARFFLLLLSAVLLIGFFAPAARADGGGPVLTAKFGVAGHYRPGGWCLVTIGVQNPGADTLSGQLQVLTAGGSASRSPYGRAGRQDTAAAMVYACPVSVPGGSAAPRFFSLYLRGVDPGRADLTVQLVDGRERGDGRVLASINNQSQNTAQAFSGVPLSPGDALLVGFGGDPSAFMFLSGRRLSSAALPGPQIPGPQIPGPQMRGFSSGSGVPVTAQVAEAATAADLPDRAAGYSGVQAFLLRSDAPLESMTEAQSGALRGWVAGGGHLIVCGGADPTRFGAAFFDGLLPATVGGSSHAGTLVLTPKPLPGVRVLQSAPGGAAQSVSGPYGAGRVTMTAFNPSAAPLQSSVQSSVQSLGQVLPPVWQKLLASAPAPTSSVLSMTAAREENFNAVYYGSAPPLLSEAVMRGPSLDAPGAWVIAVFLLAYLVVLVPVNYFVLKKLDRKELAWLTIPALVFLFAAGTFAVGYAAKGGSLFVNRAAVIETRAGQTQAGVYSEIGLFSPHRTAYDISLSGDNLLAAVPNPGTNYGGGDQSQDAGPVQLVETPHGVFLPNTPVNMWAMRAFDVPSTTDLGGAIDGALADAVGAVKGSLTNHTPYALTDCAVQYAGRWQQAGTLAPGGTVTLPVSRAGSTPQAVFPSSGIAADTRTSAGGDIGDRMHAALASYFQSLSQSASNNYYGGSPTAPVYAPAPGEALLIGWSRDPNLAGPAPRIDGQPVAVNNVSLVIVHLPVSGAPQPAPAAVQSQPGVTGALIGPGGFGVVGRATLSYRQARDTRTLSAAQAAALVGHVVRLRGTVFAFSQYSRSSATLSFTPSATPSGVTALLPFSSGLSPATRLVGREVVLTGTLTRSGRGVLLIVSHANWVQVVP